MARILFTTMSAFGHAAPLGSLAAELSLRGHVVAWAAGETIAGQLQPRGVPVYLTPEPRLSLRISPRWTASIRQFFEEVVPAATHAALEATCAAVDRFAPDLVVTEQNCLSGSMAARRARVPWLSVFVTPLSLVDPFGDLHGVSNWVQQRFAAPQLAAGVEPLPWPLRSPGGSLIAASRAFVGPDARLDPGDRFVGALVEHRATELPEGLVLGPRPRCFVSLGTAMGPEGSAFLDAVIDGLSQVDGSVVIASPEERTGLPDRIAVYPWVPQLAVLSHVDDVVCHGGQGTVSESLLHGCPLVVAPVHYDQPGVARRVQTLGAGSVLHFPSVTAEALGTAVTALRRDPAFAARAQALGAGFREAGGTRAAADAVEARLR